MIPSKYMKYRSGISKYGLWNSYKNWRRINVYHLEKRIFILCQTHVMFETPFLKNPSETLCILWVAAGRQLSYLNLDTFHFWNSFFSFWTFWGGKFVDRIFEFLSSSKMSTWIRPSEIHRRIAIYVIASYML